MLTIRKAGPEDAHEIARLNNIFNGVETPAAKYAARLAEPLRIDIPILAEVNGSIIGLANLRLAPSLYYDQPYAELSELFVEEAYRRQGAGQALVRFAERLADEAGAEEMIILTDFYNHTAQMLYLKLGYQIHDLALSKNINHKHTE